MHQLEVITEIIQDLARQAGLADPEHAGDQTQILMTGATVSATRGDLDAAKRARELAELLLPHAR